VRDDCKQTDGGFGGRAGSFTFEESGLDSFPLIQWFDDVRLMGQKRVQLLEKEKKEQLRKVDEHWRKIQELERKCFRLEQEKAQLSEK
jgi:hypothetical protein